MFVGVVTQLDTHLGAAPVRGISGRQLSSDLAVGRKRWGRESHARTEAGTEALEDVPFSVADVMKPCAPKDAGTPC